MSQKNAVLDGIHTHAKMLLGAMFQLGRTGCTPREVQITARRARILIDPPPAGSFIAGAMRSRQTFNGTTRTVYVAPFHGCQLEWEETRQEVAARAGAR